MPTGAVEEAPDVLVEQIEIPHTAGPIVIPFDARVTVFAGLDAPGRSRLVDLLVTGLVGDGPATVTVRTDDGEQTRIGPGSALEDEPDAAAVLRRLVVVGREHLGLDPTPPDASLAGERTATSIAHRELIREVHVLEAGAAERARLEAELGSAPAPPPPPVDVTEPGPDLDALARCAPMIDELLRRRQKADDALQHARAALRSADTDADATRRPGDGDPRPSATGPATGLRAAVEVLRRVDGAPGAGPDQVVDARLAVDRARQELEATATEAEAEVAASDRELGIIAAAADLPVTVTGPGAALTAALARRHRRWAAADEDPAARLLARRRAALAARIEELPDAADVAAARRRLDEVTDRLQRLGGRGGGSDVTRARQALIGRAAALRPDGVAPIAPLVVDEALVGLPADHLCDLLDLVLRISERAQVVVLSGDPALAVWARHRARVGELRLVELGVRTT